MPNGKTLNEFQNQAHCVRSLSTDVQKCSAGYGCQMKWSHWVS